MAIIARGIIKPNKPYVQHAHGDVVFTAPREFAVDDAATSVTDKAGESLVLPVDFYEGLKKKFGGTLVCEPVAGDTADAKLAAADARVAELEQQLAATQARIAELEQQLAGKGKGKKDAAPAAE